MGLPLTTTTISTTRVSNNGTVDLIDESGAGAAVLTSVGAVITSPTSRTSLLKGQRVVTSAGFRVTGQQDIRTGDVMTDNTSGRVYQVLWALSRYELGIEYTFGDLLIVEGAPS